MDLQPVLLVVACLSLLASLLAYFFPRERIERHQDKLRNAERYRLRAVEDLKRRNVGELYIQILRTALVLAWRMFGRRNGSKALARNLWLAVAYSWALFWLCWMIGYADEVTLLGIALEVDSFFDRLRLGVFALLLPFVASIATLAAAHWLTTWSGRLFGNRSRSVRHGLRFIACLIAGGCLVLARMYADDADHPTGISFSTHPGHGLDIVFGVAGVGVACTMVSVWLAGLVRIPTRATVLVIPVGAGVAGLVLMLLGESPYPVRVTEVLFFYPLLGLVFAPVAVIVGALLVSVAGVLAVDTVLSGLSTPYADIVVIGAWPVLACGVAIGGVMAAWFGKGAARAGANVAEGRLLCAALGVMFGLSVYQLDNLVDSLALFLAAFLFLLPLANGVCDWASWWCSRTLGLHLRKRLVRAKTYSKLVRNVVCHTAADVAFAVSILTILAVGLALLFEAVDQLDWGGFFGGVDLDVENTIEKTRRMPLREGLWLTTMLVSTLVPTVVHFAFVAFSPLMLLVNDMAQRRRWAAQLEPTVFDRLSEEDKFVTSTEVAEWYTRRFRRPTLWFVACWSGLSLLIVLSLVMNSIAKAIFGEDRGLGWLIGEAALRAIAFVS